MTRLRLFALSALAMLAFSATASLAPKAHADDAIVSGTYQLDPNHTSITFKINHLGFSFYSGRFDVMEATLNLNGGAVEQSALDVTIYPNSIDTNNHNLEESLRDDKWFDVIKYPRATFQSTKIERTGGNTATITGDFTLMGATRTLILNATMIGNGINPLSKKQTIGFSATTSFKRSDFGLSNMVPMVGDEVTLDIETEFDKTE